MKQMKLINHEMFSLKFIDRKKGKIYIGDLSPELKNQNKLFDKCILQKSDKVAEKIKWACQLTQIFIGELSNEELIFGQMEKVYKISKEKHPIIDDINQRAEFETTVNRIILPYSEGEEYFAFFEENYFLNDKHQKICSKIKKEKETSFECQIEDIKFFINLNFVFDNSIALFIYKEDLFDCDIKTNKCNFLISINENVDKFVFGLPLLQQFHTVFDHDSKYILFHGSTNKAKVKIEGKETSFFTKVFVYLCVFTIVICFILFMVYFSLRLRFLYKTGINIKITEMM